MKVLAVDDSEDIHELLSIRLAAEELELHHAYSGNEGFELARTLQPDLVLLDICMPGPSGFDTCTLLKNEPLTAHIPVVFLTAAGDTYNKVQGLNLGASDYIIKPFDMAELQARVRAHLRTKRFHDLLETRAGIDGLTGVFNRGHFNNRLEDEMASARRYGRKVSLVLADLDRFRELNELYGYPFGDAALRYVAEALETQARSSDAVCRVAGEKFGLILTETPLEGAVHVAWRAMEQIRGLRWRQRHEVVSVTASMGVASTERWQPEECVSEALIVAADTALAEAKKLGRDRIEIALPECQTRAV